jgi:hypothetical protein
VINGTTLSFTIAASDVVSVAETNEQIEDAILASGYGLQGFFDDFKKVLCDRWIQNNPSFFNLPCGNNCRFSDGVGVTEADKIVWFGQKAREFDKTRVVSDIDALGYHYGWEPYTWANASLYWPFDSNVPSAAVVNAQRQNGDVLYSASYK